MNSTLLTLAEQSGFEQTGRLEEVDQLCAAMAAEWPDAVRCFEFGQSAEGRPMRALIATRYGVWTAKELHDARVPILMIQAGIHPGESDGKDGGFIALRELLSDDAPSPLENIALLFVPAFNTDGHERVGRWNRPNQNGPQVTGWRTTAENLNLNRDYTKADTPEMQAMLGLISTWDPLICADLHVTDGADFEPDISIQVEPINQGDPELRASGIALRDRLIANLARNGSMPLPFYPDLVETDNPESGFVLTVYSPRFSTGYFPQRNRFTVLVETHSWKPYARRVRIMRNTIMGLARLTADHGSEWLAKAKASDQAACALGGSPMTLDFKSSWREPAAAGKTVSTTTAGDSESIDFRGYAYTRKPSDISGGLVTVYDASTPQIWRVPYRNRVEPALIVQAPHSGYIIPQAYSQEIGARLRRHGIVVLPLPVHLGNEPLQQFRADRVSYTPRPFEGRMRATIIGEWSVRGPGTEVLALFVPIAQPLARLVLALLEPQAPDSLAAWGFFNACFEQKEQLEPYVAEQIAQTLLASDPKLREEFARELEKNAAFRADSAARLEFFCRRHASWDLRFNCYPIYRA